MNKDQPKEESHHSQKEEEDNKDNEYTLCLKTALNEAISENDFVSEIYNTIASQWAKAVKKSKWGINERTDWKRKRYCRTCELLRVLSGAPSTEGRRLRERKKTITVIYIYIK